MMPFRSEAEETDYHATHQLNRSLVEMSLGLATNLGNAGIQLVCKLRI